MTYKPGSWQISYRERFLLDSVGEGVFVLDLEGRTTFVNRAAEELTGYDSEDLIGKINHEALRHFHPEGTPYLFEECTLCGAFREGKAYQTSDEVFRRKDGPVLLAGYTSDSVVEKGEVVGAVIVFREVSGLRKTRKDLETVNVSA